MERKEHKSSERNGNSYRNIDNKLVRKTDL